MRCEIGASRHRFGYPQYPQASRALERVRRVRDRRGRSKSKAGEDRKTRARLRQKGSNPFDPIQTQGPFLSCRLVQKGAYCFKSGRCGNSAARIKPAPEVQNLFLQNKPIFAEREIDRSPTCFSVSTTAAKRSSCSATAFASRRPRVLSPKSSNCSPPTPSNSADSESTAFFSRRAVSCKRCYAAFSAAARINSGPRHKRPDPKCKILAFSNRSYRIRKTWPLTEQRERQSFI